MRIRTAIACLLALTAAVYGAGLAYSPIHMHDVEVLFALHARSIASTWRDTNGTFLPLYFHMPSIGEGVWFHPMIVYVSAAVLKFLPFSEWSVRLPSVIVGTADVGLIYLVGCRLFKNGWYAVAAAALLALTPAHFIHSRIAMDYIYPLPFVLTWLWCLLEFDEHGKPWTICAAGFALGLGFYSYIAAVAFMPLYLLFTWIFLAARFRRPSLAHLWVTVAFCVPLVFFLVWRLRYPDVFSGTAYRYAITRSGVIVGMLRLLNYNIIQEYVSLYWNFYNPTYLFFVGSPNVQSSTREAGVFLLPVIVLLVAGIYEVAVRERSRQGWLLLAGFVTAPLPAVLVEEPFAIYRELVLLPFAILLATFGLRRLLHAERSTWRVVAVAALLAMPVQFGRFLENYLTDYRLNAYIWFGGNTRGTVEKVLELDAGHRIPAVYLSAAILYARERWQFYLALAGREDMLARTRSFGPTDTTAGIPPGSLVVVPVADREVRDTRMTPAAVRKVAEIAEPFRSGPTPFVQFAVFERP